MGDAFSKSLSISTEWQCLKNKTGMYKAVTIFKCVMLLTLTCRNLKYRCIGRHMAVTPFKFPPHFRKPTNIEIPKRLGVRAVVVDSSNNFLLTLQDILNPDLSLTFGKMQVIKYYSRFSRFLLLRQDYS